MFKVYQHILHSTNPTANVFQGTDVRPMSAVERRRRSSSRNLALKEQLHDSKDHVMGTETGETKCTYHP